jgi:hypothetical protein
MLKPSFFVVNKASEVTKCPLSVFKYHVNLLLTGAPVLTIEDY